MGSRFLFAAIAGCASQWPDDGIAPVGEAPWAYPTDTICEERDDPDAFEVDGYLFCGSDAGEAIVAVDEPILEPCSEAAGDGSGLVFAVFDGTRAQAYPLALLQGRELVHVNWDGEPLLVDY